MNKKQFTANILMFIAAFIWGVGFIAQKMAIGNIEAFTFNALKFLIGGLSMLPLMLYYKKKPETGTAADKVPLKKTVIPGILIGFALCAAAALQQIGIATTTAGKAGFITDLYIILIPIAEVFIGRKISKTVWPCAVIALVGLYFISVSNSFSVSKGDLIVFIGSFFWTLQMLLIDKFSKNYNLIRLSFIQYMTCAAVSAIIALFTENITLSGIMAGAGPVLYSGIMSVGVAYTLQIAGQRYAKPSTAAIILSMESVVGAVSGVIVLHERMTVRTVVGCVLMISAMVLIEVLPVFVDKLKKSKQIA
jgi:drug/metabolite transporter (DMT)-like permease